MQRQRLTNGIVGWMCKCAKVREKERERERERENADITVAAIVIGGRRWAYTEAWPGKPYPHNHTQATIPAHTSRFVVVKP